MSNLDFLVNLGSTGPHQGYAESPIFLSGWASSEERISYRRYNKRPSSKPWLEDPPNSPYPGVPEVLSMGMWDPMLNLLHTELSQSPGCLTTEKDSFKGHHDQTPDNVGGSAWDIFPSIYLRSQQTRQKSSPGTMGLLSATET